MFACLFVCLSLFVCLLACLFAYCFFCLFVCWFLFVFGGQLEFNNDINQFSIIKHDCFLMACGEFFFCGAILFGTQSFISINPAATIDFFQCV